MNRANRRMTLVKGRSQLVRVEAELAETRSELARIEASTTERFHSVATETADQLGNRILALAENLAPLVIVAENTPAARRLIENAIIECLGEFIAEVDAYYADDGPDAA